MWEGSCREQHLYIRMYVCTYAYTYIRTYIHTHSYIYIYTYMYICISVSLSACHFDGLLTWSLDDTRINIAATCCLRTHMCTQRTSLSAQATSSRRAATFSFACAGRVLVVVDSTLTMVDPQPEKHTKFWMPCMDNCNWLALPNPNVTATSDVAAPKNFNLQAAKPAQPTNKIVAHTHTPKPQRQPTRSPGTIVEG